MYNLINNVMSGSVYHVKSAEKNTLSYKITDHWELFSREYTNRLKGKLLTLIDASVANPEQCKAQKDIIKQILEDAMSTHFYPSIIGANNYMAKALGEDIMDENKYFSHITYINDLPLKYKYNRIEETKK